MMLKSGRNAQLMDINFVDLLVNSYNFNSHNKL